MIFSLIILCFRVKDSDSFFRITRRNLPKCAKEKEISPKCGCYGTYPKCADPKGDYLLRTDITKACRKKNKDNGNTKTNQINQINKRDGGDENDEKSDTAKEDFIDADDLNNDQTELDVVEREQDPREELSEEDGKRRCSAALMSSPTYGICSGRVDTSEIVEKCALDVDVSWEFVRCFNDT